MLQFIYGKASSGKTYTLINKIKELSVRGEQSVLLVPEQFTFESERLILKELGDKFSLNVSVLSFSRLYDEVGRNLGGIAGTVLGEADKVIFMSKALNSLKNELKLWRKYVGSVSFAKTILDTIGEFKINGCSSDDLLEAANNIDNPSLSIKLKELALIYNQYDLLVGEKFIDPADNLTKLYYTLGNYNFFGNKSVFIDSFKGFTGQQFKIIKRIISQAENAYIALTDDPECNKPYSIYTNIRAVADKICRYALSCSKEILEPIVLSETHYNGATLKNLEKLMSGSNIEEFTDDGSVVIAKENDGYSEAEAVARIIRRLVREEGYRYRDFVIIARDSNAYNEAVANACKRNNISLFYDNSIPLSAFPFSVAIEAAISAINFNTSDILRFNKTGLGNLNFDEIFELETYVYLWNIEGDDWLKNWNMNPKGFTTEQTDQNELSEKLEFINSLRIKAITPILNLKQKFNDDAKKMVTAIIELISECDFKSSLIKLSKKFKNEDSFYTLDVLKSAYEQYINILNSLIRCYGDSRISTTEFVENLRLSVSLASVGVIPQMLDQVTFGSADRIRPSRPKIAFIIGANQGVFPQSTSNNGLFNLIERRNMIATGISVADNSIYSYIDEEYLVYCNVCSPSEKLFVFYSEQTISGEALEPSAFVLNTLDKLSLNTVSFLNGELSGNNSPETVDTAFSEYCKNLLTNPDTSATIFEAVKETKAENDIKHLRGVITDTEKSLDPKIAKKLYGNNLRLSATRFDTFNRCKFSYFCRYGLGAKSLQPADFDVLQRGTIVHYVLEMLITEHKDDISLLSVEELDLLTVGYINSYLDRGSGYRSSENARSRFLVSRITRSLKEAVHHIAAEISQSKFKPIACELSIGKEDSDISVIFPFDDGNISLIGSIDRVDEYNGYIRIIDYKTGSKAFKLPDILFGLNLQMLIYLYAVIRGRGLSDDNTAGILYQPSKRDLNDNGMAMNGLLPLEPDLIFAMDKNGEGEFVPKLSFNKDGSVSKRNTSFIEKESFSEIFDYIELLMRKTGNGITSGNIKVLPTDGREAAACKYCEFATVCGFGNKAPMKVPELDNQKVIEQIKEAKSNGI
ncbi:MAG: exodeoxyribonuclease V subunit gamma [Clostridia bacterium]|nr:exodeoxyribonuclease V subunit gamma [Clostridia bacterium]